MAIMITLCLVACILPCVGHRFTAKSITLCGVDTTTAASGSSFSLTFVIYNQQMLAATVSGVGCDASVLAKPGETIAPCLHT
jgi:hypothetical protein